MTTYITQEQVRKAGGIVHRDGNIFFTSIEQLNAAIQHYINSQPVRVPMTDEEALLKARATGGLFDDLAVNFQSDDIVTFARAIEAHHNIKEVK